MRVPKAPVAVTGVVCVVAALWFAFGSWPEPPQRLDPAAGVSQLTNAPTDPRDPQRAEHAAADSWPHPRNTESPAPTSAGAAASSASQATRMAAQFDAADDLYAYAQSLRDAANAGNGQAQWYLAEAFDHCEFYASKFGGQPPERAQIALNHWAEQLTPESSAYWQRNFERCQGFIDDPLAVESPEIWRTLASESGYPAAVLVSLIYSTIPDALPDPSLQEVAPLFETGDPAALAQARLLLALDTGEAGVAGNAIRDLVWTLLPCEFGVDCSAESPAVEMFCRWGDCAGIGETLDLHELVAREADPFVRGETERLVTQLTQAIRARRLAESGLVALDLPEPASPPPPPE